MATTDRLVRVVLSRCEYVPGVNRDILAGLEPRLDRYTFRTAWSDEDDEYVGTCDEFPGLSWLARSRTEAAVGIRRVVREAVADMQATGEMTL